MTIDAATLRRILAGLLNIDRDRLPSLSDDQWGRFRDDPFHTYLRLPDQQQEEIALIIFPRPMATAGIGSPDDDYDFDRLLGPKYL